MCMPPSFNLQQAWSLKWVCEENSEWYYASNQRLSKEQIEEMIKILNIQIRSVFFLPEIIQTSSSLSDKTFYRLCIKKEYYEILRKKCE